MSADANQPHITITPGGPYLVTEGIPLTERYIETTATGESLTWEPIGVAGREQSAPVAAYALCRCGQSQDKPYCDGTHTQVIFDGALAADRAPSATHQRVLTGPAIEMTDDERLCVHAKFCMTRRSNAWRMVRQTGDPEVHARLATIIANCPSGRLALRTREGRTPIEPEYHPSIAAVPDGPLWVRGGIPLVAPDGFTYEVRNRMTLCRCGQSSNKPFCDGSHVASGFQAPGRETTGNVVPSDER